jgi:hypothetical protein
MNHAPDKVLDDLGLEVKVDALCRLHDRSTQAFVIHFRNVVPGLLAVERRKHPFLQRGFKFRPYSQNETMLSLTF